MQKNKPQQLLLLFFLFYAIPFHALKLQNNSNITIRFNIFRKNHLTEPFSKASGILDPGTSYEVKNLQEQASYQVMFYNPYNALHNQMYLIPGSQKIITYSNEKQTSVKDTKAISPLAI